MPTFDGSYSSTVKAWRKELDTFLMLHPVVEKKAFQIAALHLLGEANVWWFSHMEHTKVTNYSDFFHKLRKKFDMRKPEMYHKEKFPKEIKEDVNLFTLYKKSLLSPTTAKVLTVTQHFVTIPAIPRPIHWRTIPVTCEQ